MSARMMMERLKHQGQLKQLVEVELLCCGGPDKPNLAAPQVVEEGRSSRLWLEELLEE